MALEVVYDEPGEAIIHPQSVSAAIAAERTPTFAARAVNEEDSVRFSVSCRKAPTAHSDGRTAGFAMSHLACLGRPRAQMGSRTSSGLRRLTKPSTTWT